MTKEAQANDPDLDDAESFKSCSSHLVDSEVAGSPALTWQQVCLEVSRNPRFTQAYQQLLAQQPLDNFTCPITLQSFKELSEDQTLSDDERAINILPSGTLYNSKFINEWLGGDQKYDPFSRKPILPGITLYVYQALMDYIREPSDEHLRKLCFDPITHLVMQTPRIITYYNPEDCKRVLVAICDENTSLRFDSEPALKNHLFDSQRNAGIVSKISGIFGSRFTYEPKFVTSLVFDGLKNFINHPSIGGRLLPLDQARSRLVQQLESMSQSALTEGATDTASLANIKLTYFGHRHSWPNPVSFFGFKSHAAKIQQAQTLEEISQLLWDSYKEGGTNASTQTIKKLNISRPT